MVDINDFTIQKDCNYKDDSYSVRDNGAIMRHPKKGKKPRKKDFIWTFGDTPHNGYLYYCGVPVHRIVATAFIGAAPTPQHVVDHIDTNRQNNRPENLRWLTKLENILLNDITRQKIEYLCGSIENFLQNPSQLNAFIDMDRNFSWMRAVSKEEAAATLMHWKELEQHPKTVYERKNPINDWIFKGSDEISSPHQPSLNFLQQQDKVKEKVPSKEEKKAAAKAKANEQAIQRKSITQKIIDIALSFGWYRRKKTDAPRNVDVVIGKENCRIGFKIFRKASNTEFTDDFKIFTLEDGKSTSPISIGLTATGNNSYTATLCGENMNFEKLIEAILTGKICIEDTVTFDTLKVRFVGENCYNCGKTHFIYVLEGLQNSQMPYLKMTLKDDYYDLEEIEEFDELSPNIVNSVQQYLSDHKKLNIPMGEIKERYSITMGESYMSFGCPYCGALVGNHYLEDIRSELMYEENDDDSVFTIPLLGSKITFNKKHISLKL